jgi:D-alanine-D-alanine ligase
LLQVEGYCRIDAFVKIFADGQVEVWIIEINSLPGMTPATCIFHQTAIQGYKPLDFISRILEFGQKRLHRS